MTPRPFEPDPELVTQRKDHMPYPTLRHLCLGDLIDALEAADPDATLPLGNPHSYRGYYDQLAFELVDPRPVRDVLADARGALGATYPGWKGGDYEMGECTPVWLAEQGDEGEALGAMLLHLLLAKD